jgi:nucleoside-diphosphate-sugar epimerase
LNSVIKYKNKIKKVVLTSSIAAVFSLMQIKEYRKITEENWNEESTEEEIMGPYRISKTKAEKVAWKICNEHNIPLTVINPSLVIGEILNFNLPLNNSIEAIKKYLLNEIKEVPNALLFYVGIRDVVKF